MGNNREVVRDWTGTDAGLLRVNPSNPLQQWHLEPRGELWYWYTITDHSGGTNISGSRGPFPTWGEAALDCQYAMGMGADGLPKKGE